MKQWTTHILEVKIIGVIMSDLLAWEHVNYDFYYPLFYLPL